MFYSLHILAQTCIPRLKAQKKKDTNFSHIICFLYLKFKNSHSFQVIMHSMPWERVFCSRKLKDSTLMITCIYMTPTLGRVPSKYMCGKGQSHQSNRGFFSISSHPCKVGFPFLFQFRHHQKSQTTREWGKSW